MANAFGVTNVDAHLEGKNDDEVMYENSDSDVNMEENEEPTSSSTTAKGKETTSSSTTGKGKGKATDPNYEGK